LQKTLYLNFSLAPTLGPRDKVSQQKLEEFLLSASELLSTPDELERVMKELDEMCTINKEQ